MASRKQLISFSLLLVSLFHKAVIGQESSFWAQFQDKQVLEEDYGFWAQAEEETTEISDLPWDSTCTNNLNEADADSDLKLSRSEYLVFIQLQSECEPGTITDIPQSQLPFYVGLACLCLGKPNASFSCCTAENSRIDIPTTDRELRVICNLRYLGGSFCGELPPELQTSPPTFAPSKFDVIDIVTISPTLSPIIDSNSDSPSSIAAETSDNPSNPAHSHNPTVIVGSDAPTTSTSKFPGDSLCTNHPVCAFLELDGECCPTVQGKFLFCCSQDLSDISSDVPSLLYSDTPSKTPLGESSDLPTVLVGTGVKVRDFDDIESSISTAEGSSKSSSIRIFSSTSILVVTTFLSLSVFAFIQI